MRPSCISTAASNRPSDERCGSRRYLSAMTAFHPLLPLTEWQNVRSRLSVRAAFGTTCQALRELLLFQEVVHHVGDSVSGSQPHRLPMTAPARPNLALLQAKNNTTRRIVGLLQSRNDVSHQYRHCDHARGRGEKHSRTRQETRQCQHMSRRAFQEAAEDCYRGERDRAGRATRRRAPESAARGLVSRRRWPWARSEAVHGAID